MRTFIAIELPEEIREALAGLQEQLKASGADVKWVAPQNIHLTLKFLGERDDKKVKRIAEILAEVSRQNNAYQVRISSLGAFPALNSPRVIWVGIEKGDTETKKISQDLEEGIAKTGIPKEDRIFSSHITIGRTRSGLGKEKLVQILEDLADSLSAKNLEFTITKITLYKSTLTPRGPIYEVLQEASLKAT